MIVNAPLPYTKISLWLILVVCLWISDPRFVESTSHLTSTSATTFLRFQGGAESSIEAGDTSMMDHLLGTDKKDEVKIVFSDLDGTLIHYPNNAKQQVEKGNSIIRLPPSSTGMRGILSSKTIVLVQEIRKEGVPFCMVSGMRTSTLLNRIPFLPRADAYCTEAGGRIFYPTEDLNSADFVVQPKAYLGSGKVGKTGNETLAPFGLQEDLEWRKQIEKTTGVFGDHSLKQLASDPLHSVAKVEERDGLLWDFARSLQEKGYVLDTKGYSACFRVNRKHQRTNNGKATTMATTSPDFAALLEDGAIEPMEGLATSVNLDCVDYYPDMSGKKNVCQYLAERFCQSENPDKLLRKHALCLCDDDNDLEMALACHHAFIPEVSSESMAALILENPDHFTKTWQEEGHFGPTSSEIALSLVLDCLLVKHKNSEENESQSEAQQPETSAQTV